MENATCNDCDDFLPSINQCGCPMVYLGMSNDTFNTTPETASCGFYFPAKVIPIKVVDQFI